MKEYEEIRGKYEESRKEYDGRCRKCEEISMEKYVENMKEYPLLYKLWDLEKFHDFPLYVGFTTWKTLGLKNIPRFPLYLMEKFRVLRLSFET